MTKDPDRTVVVTPWASKGFGNHRAIVRVDCPLDVVRVMIPWRRRDKHPEKIGLRIMRLSDGSEITNILPVRLNRESGEILFQASQPGDYAVYFMPFEIEDQESYRPMVLYRQAAYPAVEPDWLARAQSGAGSNAKVLEIQARTEEDRFDPMELIACAEEVASLVARCGARAFYVFPEDRKNPIRMHSDLPAHWAQQGPIPAFSGTARPNEYYAFQIGVWARQQLRDVKVGWGAWTRAEAGGETSRVSSSGSAASPFAAVSAAGKGLPALPGEALTCFNLGGVDWLGRSFSKRIDVEAGEVQALWFGVDLPDTAAGVYRTTIQISAEGVAAQSIAVEIRVDGAPLADRGDGELWRHSRLRWLNSTIGLDDELPAGYPALQISGPAVTCQGRTVRFGALGLPAQITSFFAPSVDRLQAQGTDVLARPIALTVRTATGAVEWMPAGAPVVQAVSAAACDVAAMAMAGSLRLVTRVRMEFDGHLECRLTMTTGAACELADIALEIPVRREVAEYMMGLGRRGGYRPDKWAYAWDLDRANHYAWLGTVNAGLHLKLKHDEDVWALSRLDACGFPRAWYNGGQGGVALHEDANGEVVLRAFCGARSLAAGEAITLRFSLMVTPLKRLDLPAHWRDRYYHPFGDEGPKPDLDLAKRISAKVVNLHHGGTENPYINYPFRTPVALKAVTSAAHERGLKLKLYYTLRELSSVVAEIWAFRSLRGEIYPEQGKADIADQFAEPASTSKEVPAIPAGPWLREHLVDRYVPAWHQGLPDGGMDQAIGTTGLSRMHNYYLEGLSWLIRELGVDGLYLDGIGYDRQVMKRVRKVMDRARPGCLLDFHSGNNYHPAYGLGNPMALYMELLPSIDSLWFGEGFDYENSEPDYFMTEICGLPFGLSNDMLQEGGNPWRGMIYGMACRFGWMQGGDPRHLWALWDSFGISQARMFGYWHRECPVRTDQPKVLATAYVKPDGTTLISVASWVAEPVTCHLVIDWAKLGLDRQKVVAITAPAIRGFQEAARFELDAGIPVEPKRGWLLVLEAGSESPVAGRAASPFAAGAKAGKGLPALPDGLTLTCDGKECGWVKVELTGPDVVVEVKVHDVAMSRNERRPERGSCCELFVSPGLAEAPCQLMFLPAVGSIPAEVHAYRNGQSMLVPSGLEWSVHLEPDGYRLVMRAARSSFGMASDATEFYFDCAAGVTEPLPYWVRTRVQLAGARYPFAKSDALLRIVAQ